MYAGATVESDFAFSRSNAPHPDSRLRMMLSLKELSPEIPRAISVEPIMKFSANFPERILEINPSIVAVGYDNYNGNLPEPSMEETLNLIDYLVAHKINVYKKSIREAHIGGCQ